MDQILRSHAEAIVKEAIAAVQPDEAVRRALADAKFPGRVLLVATGKADVMKMVTNVYEMEDALAAFKALANNDGTLAKLLIHIG